MNCTYCHLEIDTDEYGWGWYYEGYDRIAFHMECVEMVEELAR